MDLAVNVRAGAPPPWLRTVLHAALEDSAAYPVAAPARAAVAAAHGREPAEVLLTAGAAEAFVLLARALRPRKAVVVHPSFTEPEAALRAAGARVTRVFCEPDRWTFAPAALTLSRVAMKSAQVVGGVQPLVAHSLALYQMP